MHRNQIQSLKCQKKCNLHKFEKQLFEYIHYCTVINVSLLLNTSTRSSGLVPLAIGPIFAGPTMYF